MKFLEITYSRFCIPVFAALAVLLCGQASASVEIAPNSTNVGRIIFVTPLPGDAATANGTALVNALAGITAASATNPYLLKLGPGIYDLGSGSLQMKAYVDIEGSGEGTTLITSAVGQNLISPTVGTVIGSNNAEIRFLTIENNYGLTAGNTYAAFFNSSASPSISHVTIVAAAAAASASTIGLYNDNSSPTLTDVTVEARDAEDVDCVMNRNSSAPTMRNVSVNVSVCSRCTGVKNDTLSAPIMTNVAVTVMHLSTWATNHIGIYNDNSNPIMTNVSVTVTGGGEGYNYGVANWSGAAPVMNNVTLTVANGSANRGVSNNESFPVMVNVKAKASGGSGLYNYGMDNYTPAAGYGITADHCTFEGSTASIRNSASYTAYVGASKLAGPIVNAGTIKCVGSYDGSLTALKTNCLP